VVNSNSLSSTATDFEELLTALYAIQALAHLLGLDPTHRFDRTAVAALIEREAGLRAGSLIR
jgi:hypothetical protein